MAPISAARHLNFPTSVTADPDGRIYIAESGLPIGGAPAEYVGHLIVALFGDECSLTGPARSRVGRKLVRVALADRSVHPVKPLPFQRPIDVMFEPISQAAYVVDFGEFEIAPDKSIVSRAGTGVLWKLPADFMDVA